jgi:hypothetical protein
VISLLHVVVPDQGRQGMIKTSVAGIHAAVDLSAGAIGRRLARAARSSRP